VHLCQEVLESAIGNNQGWHFKNENKRSITDQVGLKVKIYLYQLPEGWDYKHASPHLAL
jgi:hypothetical protein